MAKGFSADHVPLRVRFVPDTDRASVENYLAACIRRFGARPWMSHGRPSASPAEMPVVRPMPWIVEDSDWWYDGREDCRRWSERCRFETKDEAVAYCRRVRDAERDEVAARRRRDEDDAFGEVL